MTSLRILLAEDHAVVREGTRQILERDPGLEVVGEAADGAEVVEMARRLVPDVVLLDLGLPRLDGLEVWRRLRARGGEIQPLIVAMTGYGQDEDRRRSEEAGFDAHMVKPMDLKVLQELLSRPGLARRGQQSKEKE